MPLYVYGCDQDKTHPRVEIAHAMKEVIFTLCQRCGSPMHRVPQLFGFGVPPMDKGLRNTYEIHSHLRSKYHDNKARREANAAAQAHARERTGR
jgi:hypothetical protein